MRLITVAKALGLTGQQLRKELTEVDFGIKPTDREVPERLAQGVLRVLARKYGKEVDMEALGFTDEDSEEGESTNQPKEVEDVEELEDVEEEAKPKESVNVLRKLSLDDVSKDAIAAQKTVSAPRKTRAKASPKAAPKKKVAEKVNQQQIKKKEGTVTLPSQVTVKEFAEKTGIQVPKVVAALMSSGIMATINQTIDYDTAAIIAAELGVDVQKEHEAASAEDIIGRNLEELLRDEPENLSPRPPIVVVMGHVDHGKTSILDAIRKTDVVSTEAGAITQHIGASQILHKSKGSEQEHAVTFLDTPGHEAFTAMRARGAQITDIAVLVVAADEGVKPTTIEAIDHAKEANVPILVAMNKIDSERADPEKVKGELAGHGLQSEDWGGKTVVVPCSAKTGQGIDELVDNIVLLSEMAELKANPNRPAIATVIESHLDPSLGPLATVIISTGTLKVGDAFVCSAAAGKVRSMMDSHGKRLDAVGPSGAVRVSGFDSVPDIGEVLQVVSSDQDARTLSQSLKEQHLASQKKSFADLVSRLSEGKLKQLKVVLKADTQGSLEAICESLQKKGTDEVTVKVIHRAVGSVSETDVLMASASDGVVIAFSVPITRGIEQTAEREGVTIREYDVIYKLLEDIDGLIEGILEPDEKEEIIGTMSVKAIFLTKKNEQIIGGKVESGVIKRLPFRLRRGGEEISTGRITQVKHVEKDIKEAKEGSECGLKVETTESIQEGDELEVFMRILKKKNG